MKKVTKRQAETKFTSTTCPGGRAGYADTNFSGGMSGSCPTCAKWVSVRKTDGRTGSHKATKVVTPTSVYYQ